MPAGSETIGPSGEPAWADTVKCGLGLREVEGGGADADLVALESAELAAKGKGVAAAEQAHVVAVEEAVGGCRRGAAGADHRAEGALEIDGGKGGGARGHRKAVYTERSQARTKCRRTADTEVAEKADVEVVAEMGGGSVVPGESILVGGVGEDGAIERAEGAIIAVVVAPLEKAAGDIVLFVDGVVQLDDQPVLVVPCGLLSEEVVVDAVVGGIGEVWKNVVGDGVEVRGGDRVFREGIPDLVRDAAGGDGGWCPWGCRPHRCRRGGRADRRPDRR